MPDDLASKANNMNIYMAEKNVCIEKRRAIVRLGDIEGLEIASRVDQVGQDEKGEAASKKSTIHTGSVFDMLRKNVRAEMRANRTERYNLFVDFDTSEPYKGCHGASHMIDINKFGKAVKPGTQSFAINNTSAANKIEFKIFRQGTR